MSAFTIEFIKGIKSNAEKSLDESKSMIKGYIEKDQFREVSRASINAEAQNEIMKHVTAIETIIEKNADNQIKAFSLILSYISTKSFTGANDRWSGRENDMVRMVHETLMEAFSSIYNSIMYDTDYVQAMKKMTGVE